MKDNKNLKILEAAIDIFLERGATAFTIRSIAKRANVSLGVINYYFPNKGILYKKFIAYVCKKILEYIDFEINNNKNAEENLKELVRVINITFENNKRYVKSFLLLKIHSLNYPTYQPYFYDIESETERTLTAIANLDNKYSKETLRYKLWSAVYYNFLILNKGIKFENIM